MNNSLPEGFENRSKAEQKAYLEQLRDALSQEIEETKQTKPNAQDQKIRDKLKNQNPKSN